MEVLLEITILLSLILALSFLIERMLELLKSFYDFWDSKCDLYKFYTRRAYKTRDRIVNKLKAFEFLKPKHIQPTLNRFQELFLHKKDGYSGTVPMLSGDLVRVVYVRIISKILGIGLGIIFAYSMHLDLLHIWQDAGGEFSKWVPKINSENLRIALTGIIMGLGSGPVHKIVQSIDKKREQKELEGVQP